MAERKELPAFVKKRKVLFGEKVSEEQRRLCGESFMEAGRYDDALEFFARSEAPDQVRQIADSARSECNVPVFLRAKVVLGEKPDKDEMEALAVRAMEAERPSMAALAYEKAGLQEKADVIRCEIYGIEMPPEGEGENDEGDEAV